MPSNCSVRPVRSSSACRLTPPSRSRSALRRVSWLSASSRRGSVGVRRQLGQRQAAVGCATELLADAACLLAATGACAFQSRLDAGARLALVGDGRLRRAQLLGRLPVGGFGGGERVGRGLPLLLGLGQLAHELLALLLDHGGQIAASVAISACVSAMRSFSVAICWSAPAERVCQRSRSSGDGRLALRAGAVLALQRDQLGAALADAGAQTSRLLLRGGQLGSPASRSAAELPAMRSRSRPAARAPRPGLPRRPRLASETAAMPGFCLARLPLHGGQHVARLRELALRLAPAAGAGAAPRPAPRACISAAASAAARAASADARAPRTSSRGQRAEPAALGQPGGGGRGHLRGGDETVPAPQIALAGDQTLAGLQQPLQARAVGDGDDADLAQAARQLGRARDVGNQRLDAGGQRRVGLPLAALSAPVHRRFLGATGASRSSPSAAGKRHLVAGRDLDLHRGPAAGRCRRPGSAAWPASRPRS